MGSGFSLALSEIAVEAFGEGGFECHWLARGGMAELEPLCMEHLSVWHREDRLVRRFPSVRRVAHDGTSDRGHVYAYLVRASREDVALHERDHAARFPDIWGDGFGVGGERAVVGDGELAVLRHDGHLLAVALVPPNQVLDVSFGGIGNPMDDRAVDLADVIVRREILGERVHGDLRLGDDHHAGGVLVEPVHDARTRHAADAFEVGAMVQDGVHERAGVVSGRGMDDETGGLVENEDVVIFEEDVERDVLRLRLRRDGRRDRDVERVRLLHLFAGLQHDFAVDLHKSRFDESLEPGTGEVWVQGRQPYVKSFAHQNCQALW